MNRISLRRLGAAAVATTLALIVTSTGSADGASATGQRAATSADKWLKGQMKNGFLESQYGASYGASVDAALSFVLAGDTAAAGQVADALAGKLGDYISGDAFGDAGSTYSGSVAKAAVLYQALGRDATNVGGVNLVSRLEAQVQASGRIQDTSTYGDYANTLGQAYAAGALATAGSADAAQVTSFLLTQQCSAGWFRLYFDNDGAATVTGTDESCADDPKSAPSVDATAVAIIELLPQAATDPSVATALTNAESWLSSVQRANGGWNDGKGAVNANSTGLAAWAMGAAGVSASAGKGGRWLLGQQMLRCGRPVLAGAIAYDPKTFTAAVKAKPSDDALVQWRVATAQAAAGLLWAPQIRAVKVAAGQFAKPGSTVRAKVKGLAPGTHVCVTVGAGAARLATLNSSGRVGIQLPTHRGRVKVAVTYAGAAAPASTRIRVRR